MKMCAKVWICKILLIRTHAKCVRCACRFATGICLQLSVDMRNFAHSHTCEMCTFKMCSMCMHVLQLCVPKCGCAKFYTFTHVRYACLFYHCSVYNCQNTGEQICLFTYIQNCQDCSKKNCFINQNQLQFDFKLEFLIIWLNSSFRYFICLKTNYRLPMLSFRLQQCGVLVKKCCSSSFKVFLSCSSSSMKLILIRSDVNGLFSSTQCSLLSSTGYSLWDWLCNFFYTNLHELFCQFISWTNWVNLWTIAKYPVKLWLIWKKLITISWLLTCTE